MFSGINSKVSNTNSSKKVDPNDDLTGNLEYYNIEEEPIYIKDELSRTRSK